MKTYQQVERRLHKRYDASIPIKYTLPDGVGGRTITKNISMGGARFRVPEKLDVRQGTRFTLRMQISGRSRATVIVAEIVWRRKFETSPGDNYDVGIKFIYADPLDVEDIIDRVRT